MSLGQALAELHILPYHDQRTHAACVGLAHHTKDLLFLGIGCSWLYGETQLSVTEVTKHAGLLATDVFLLLSLIQFWPWGCAAVASEGGSSLQCCCC